MKKKIYMGLILLAGLSATAQVENRTAEDRNEDATDRLQQQAPRETQSAVDRAARAAEINTQNSQNVISAQNRLQSEKERSTGKPDVNPALENPKTVHPVNIADPTSNPGRK